MKIGYCPACKDIFKLTWNVKECNCGKSSSVLKEQGTLSLTGPLRILEINDSSLYEAVNDKSNEKKEVLVMLWPKNSVVINKIRPTATMTPADVYKKSVRSPYLPKLVSIAEAVDEDYLGNKHLDGPECRLCGSAMKFDDADTWVCPSCGEIMEVPY